jgi:hypothetical protein
MNKPAVTAAKPDLTLIPGHQITAENLAKLFTHLTGKSVTPEQLEEARATLGDTFTPMSEGKR